MAMKNGKQGKSPDMKNNLSPKNVKHPPRRISFESKQEEKTQKPENDIHDPKAHCRGEVDGTAMALTLFDFNPVLRKGKHSLICIMIKVFFWNCRGAKHLKFCPTFDFYKSTHKPNIVCIVEPRVSRKDAIDIISTLGFDSCEISDASGFSGGIWALWNKSDVQMSNTEIHKQFIHLDCSMSSGECCALTAIYANPNEHARREYGMLFVGSIIESVAFGYCLEISTPSQYHLINREEPVSVLPKSNPLSVSLMTVDSWTLDSRVLDSHGSKVDMELGRGSIEDFATWNGHKSTLKPLSFT
ncbi:unnamed protein product [Linum trigynum]|uniref:Uncharacterized protein n=1 Tax=Linum trigynum TaxID=586398 RepID=A0AAV2EFB7_9ROSI